MCSSWPDLPRSPGALTPGVIDAEARCEATFGVAEAIRLAIDATQPIAGDGRPEHADGTPWDYRTALVDLPIRACATSPEWLSAAAVHPVLFDGADPTAVLATRCADPVAGLASTIVCVELASPTRRAGPGGPSRRATAGQGCAANPLLPDQGPLA